MLKKRFISWISQIVGLSLMLTILLLPRGLQLGDTWPEWFHAFFLTSQKIIYTTGVYLIILPTIL